MNTNEKNVNEKNLGEEVLDEVSGGMPIGNRVYRDNEGHEHNTHITINSGPMNGREAPVIK